MIILIDAQRSFDKIQHTFQIRVLEIAGLEVSASILESIEHAYHLSLNEHSEYYIPAPAIQSVST